MRKQILLALGMVFLLFVLIDVFKSLLPTFSLPYIPNAYSPKGSLRSVDLSLPGGIPLQYITQGYGATSFAYAAGGYAKPWHNGVDIAAVEGAEIHSAKDGTIIFTGNQDNFCPGRGFGKFIVAQNSSDGFFLL